MTACPLFSDCQLSLRLWILWAARILFIFFRLTRGVLLGFILRRGHGGLAHIIHGVKQIH